MRRALITTALVAAALAAAAPASAATPAKVRLLDCSLERNEAVFQGSMRRVSGATGMAMRFTLLEKTGRGPARPVAAPELRRWHRAKPGVRRFVFTQRFRNLPENASHRVRVSFRWYSEDGDVIVKGRRRSRPCRQFKLLPNLAVDLTRIVRSQVPGVWRYRATVRNSGRAGATAVPVRLTVDGDVVDTVRIASLRRGERRTVVIRGPQCSRLAHLEVDPEQAIAETSDDDNADELGCGALMNAR
jgi:CARDB